MTAVMSGSLIFVIGAPGSGKGTLCKRLAEHLGFDHISVGDLLRRLVATSEVDPETAARVRDGDLIHAEALGTILVKYLDGARQRNVTVLLDGFPRKQAQMAPIEALLGRPELVMFFDCPEQIAMERYLSRNLVGRENDTAELFTKRYAEFEAMNSPIIEEYQKRGNLVSIDTSGETTASFGKVLKALDEWRGGSRA